MRDFDALMREPFERHRQLEDRVRDRGHGEPRRRDGDERRQEDRAIVVFVADRRLIRGVGWRVGMWVGVPRPVRVNGATLMMRGRVVVRVRVNERCAQGRELNGRRKRDGNELPHDRSIVREPGQAVKRRTTESPDESLKFSSGAAVIPGGPARPVLPR